MLADEIARQTTENAMELFHSSNSSFVRRRYDQNPLLSKEGRVRWTRGEVISPQPKPSCFVFHEPIFSSRSIIAVSILYRISYQKWCLF